MYTLSFELRIMRCGNSYWREWELALKFDGNSDENEYRLEQKREQQLIHGNWKSIIVTLRLRSFYVFRSFFFSS